MSIYNGKNIVVLGAGITGLSCINFFLSLGVYPKLIDHNYNVDKNLIPDGIDCYFGDFNKNLVLYSDLIVISPGISSYSNLILQARNKGIEIINDVEIFFREVKTSVIAITGTNGKSTVVSLLYNICKIYGLNVSLGGNIGIPALNLLNNKSDLYILELSSFQLEFVFSLKTLCSCLLNITCDHLDRYPNGIKDYIFTKFKIFNNSNYCLINILDKNIISYNFLNKNLITFGISKANYYLDFYKNKIFLSKKKCRLIDTNNIYLKGINNYLNFLAIIAISEILNIPKSIYLNRILTFRGLKHRFSIVHNNNGVLWINDSKSTNIGSTISALKLLCNVKGLIWLLLGGDGKMVDFNYYLKPYLLIFKDKLRICCFGKSRNILFNLIPNISMKFFTLKEVVIYISNLIKNGDVVLLSPGCSSLDQFNSYKDRGNKFIFLSKIYG